ncbi:MAG: Gfo/Idh/MocA family protein, partial [Flavobacteriales bacterium]
MTKRITIGVAGAGHLVKIHLKCLRELDQVFELRGLFDPDEKAAAEASLQFDCKIYNSLEEMIDDCDAIDIVCPTAAHFSTAVTAIKSLRHVFIEKPVTNTSEEART